VSFLKPVAYYYNIIFVKEAEYSKNIGPRLNPNLINPVRIFEVSEIHFRNSVKVLNYFQRPKNSTFDFDGLSRLEFVEIVFIKEKISFLCHASKV
jgi:hypothetical protein